MASAFAGTLHLVLRVSATQRIFVIALHGVAAIVVVSLALHRPWLSIALPLIAGSFYCQWQRAALRTPASVVHLRWSEDDVWAWQTADRRWHEGDLCNAFVAGTGLVVLDLREQGQRLRRTHCLLFNDALSARAHRQLRARLTVNPPLQPPVDA